MDNLEVKVIPDREFETRLGYRSHCLKKKNCKRDRGRANFIVVCEFFLELLPESVILSQSLEYLGLSMCYLA